MGKGRESQSRNEMSSPGLLKSNVMKGKAEECQGHQGMHLLSRLHLRDPDVYSSCEWHRPFLRLHTGVEWVLSHEHQSASSIFLTVECSAPWNLQTA